MSPSLHAVRSRAESPNGDRLPVANVFTKTEHGIRHFNRYASLSYE